MQSRAGISTISQYTCFFRGAAGELGGQKHCDNVQSTVKKLQKHVENKFVSDIVNDPVETSDVKAYI